MRNKLAVCSAFLFVLTAFGVCGCSDAATSEKRLSADMKYLISQYMKSEFAKQIKLNSQSKAFLISENKLLLLEFDGIEAVPRTAPHGDLIEMAVARHYAGQELDIFCRKASWSKLTKIKHERYTYRALVSLDFVDKRRMWQHVPAVSIVMTDFKIRSTPDKLKSELLNNAVRALPDEKFDYNYIYIRPSSSSQRNFTATFFVCYDPELPGWVAEDAELAGSINVAAVPADWLNNTFDKLKPEKGIMPYKQELYWQNSKTIRQNYDNGLVFFDNQWMPADQAVETVKLNALTAAFDPGRATVEELTDFLQKLKSFSARMDLTAGLQKAVSCAELHINNLRNENSCRKLEDFLALMQEEPAYSQGFEQVKEKLKQTIIAAKRRINQQLDNAVMDIKNALKSIVELKASNNLTHNRINIECVRQDNILKRVCPHDSKDISRQLFRLRFLLLLQHRHFDEINKLYKSGEYRNLLPELEKSVITDCKNCRKGVQACIYCAKHPGKCPECNGSSFKIGSPCAECKSSGICMHCKGSRRMKCMNCNGRGFLILFSTAEAVCNKTIAEFEFVLGNNIKELESKKYALP